MIQPDGHHLAELNVARLIADPDALEVAEFVANLDRINDLGKRMPGFQWIMEGSGTPGTGNMENCIGNDPRYVANLTVWENVNFLRKFVFDTVHAQFLTRRHEWFQVLKEMHFVMWWVPAGHRPSLAEALERLDHLRGSGNSDFAFGWDFVESPTAEIIAQE